MRLIVYQSKVKFRIMQFVNAVRECNFTLNVFTFVSKSSVWIKSINYSGGWHQAIHCVGHSWMCAEQGEYDHFLNQIQFMFDHLAYGCISHLLIYRLVYVLHIQDVIYHVCGSATLVAVIQCDE